MPPEPKTKRAVSFIDGQNLFRHAKEAFGHHHPNYDPLLLAEAVCARQGWFSQQVRFYTGLPSRRHDPRWHGYWTRRLAGLSFNRLVVAGATRVVGGGGERRLRSRLMDG